MKADGFLSERSLFVHPLNEKGEKATPADCFRYAIRWTEELWKLARTDRVAQKLLRALSGEVVGWARSRSEDNSIFTHAADPFLEVYKGGKALTQSNQFCQNWLWEGLLHADGVKISPQGYEIRRPEEMAKLALAALEDAFGKQWQDAEEVIKEFNRRGRKYSTKGGAITWEEMSRGVRRELVRKTIRAAATTWKRQADKRIRSKKSQT